MTRKTRRQEHETADHTASEVGKNESSPISSLSSFSRFTQSAIPVHRMVPVTIGSVAPPRLHLPLYKNTLTNRFLGTSNPPQLVMKINHRSRSEEIIVEHYPYTFGRNKG